MVKPEGPASGIERRVLLAATLLALALTRLHAYDPHTWWLEVAPVFIALPILFVTARAFPLTPLLYRLLFLHALVLMIGGHWTYARVPIGDWARHAFGFSRNHYDRLGHFVQGFVPAMAAREILLRRSPLREGKWLFFLVACVCLAISATYELVEWWTALATGEAATAFLGTQGDPWDTQWDMLCALVGALTAQATLRGVHARELAALPAPGDRG